MDVAAFVPSNATMQTVYVPGVSNTCDATGPIAALRLRLGIFGVLVQVPLPGSPKFHRYSRSWKGRVVAVAVVPVASKNTANGATPDTRLATREGVMAPVAAVMVVHPGIEPGGVESCPTGRHCVIAVRV